MAVIKDFYCVPGLPHGLIYLILSENLWNNPITISIWEMRKQSYTS